MNYSSTSLDVKAFSNNFNFSLLPFTATELENAYHAEELPPARRTVLLIAAKVRGVGGIDSWGSTPEEQYQISASRSYKFDVVIK